MTGRDFGRIDAFVIIRNVDRIEILHVDHRTQLSIHR